ncbi:MAG TPA: thioredoxin domain-containing protein [Candidatus Paceibacterota bacterium]
MDNNVKIFISVIGILVLGTIATVLLRVNTATEPAGPGKYDEFTKCLEEKGAVFYGAFWCAHCQATKKLFGSSAKLLPYVECSTADAKGQTAACIDKKIKSYPTWEFADGSRLTGELTLQQLADKTSCVLPQ